MKRLKTSIAAWSALFAVIGFWVANQIFPPDIMTEVSSGLVFGVAFTVLLRWAGDAFRSLRSGRDGPEFLIVSVFSIVLIIFLQRIWVTVLRIYDRPEWLVNSPVSAFVAWMMAWACTLALIAPDVDNGAIPTRSRLLVGVALFVAGMVSGISITLSLS